MEPASYPENLKNKIRMKDENNQNHAPSYSAKRGQWANKREFILSVSGQIIGLGNVWRFPYLCFKNGGGAFLIPYVVFLFTCGIPIFFLEVSLGQLTGQGEITCWRKICPIFEGLGYGSQVTLLYNMVYYIVILAWAFLYLFSSFHTVLPWASCNNTWNTDNCIDCGQNYSVYFHINENATSSVKEFWQRSLGWIICYFCIWKGVKATGKVVYITATFPVVMLIVMLIYGLTLPGAVTGIRYYLYPDLTRLTDPQVWMDAGSQILFSFGICEGAMQAMGSYNKYNNNCYKDTFALCALNGLTSFVAGFAVFSVLGFMSHDLGVDISTVAESGPGLAFIAYPLALSMMPLPQLWAVFFFIMIILLGLDSEFVCLEGLVTAISDMFPSLFLIGHRRKLLLLIICGVSFVIGLCLVTEGGLYVFLLFDYYACSGIPFMIYGILECVCVGWIYGADRYYDNIKEMIGYYPSSLMKYCWKFITPCLCVGTLIFSLVKFTPLKYNNTYEYPWWGFAIGMVLALSPVLLTPLWIIYCMAVTPGTLRQRLKTLCTPAFDLHSSPKKILYPETAPPDTELHALT
ncbi:hypothetical protein JOQ06_001912 [Pogonophryne albipinna]|uniref:Transporter n=1 Tax=Pogonophryne albipinna TaxID=1090488 RepID=A0AAD6B5Z3_9TELE|nr:hypothetical protein JOQ06_001912 [Pogonophryne albipinna]